MKTKDKIINIIIYLYLVISWYFISDLKLNIYLSILALGLGLFLITKVKSQSKEYEQVNGKRATLMIIYILMIGIMFFINK
ncbi:MAG: hypothetical protein ACK5HR_07400 [Mycoplasmatales bacterium]